MLRFVLFIKYAGSKYQKTYSSTEVYRHSFDGGTGTPYVRCPVQQATSGSGHRVKFFFFFLFGVETNQYNTLNLKNKVTFRFFFKQQQRIIW